MTSLAVAFLAIAGLATTRTSAAWTDQVAVTAVVSAGYWDDNPFAGVITTEVQGVAIAVESVVQGQRPCAVVTITTDSAAPLAWSLRLDTTVPPFAGLTLADVSVTPGSAVADGDSLLVTGRGAGGSVVAGTPATVRICVPAA
ncbi:hypothetical protein [Demequina pelophila]|uniref:hypothetical protein n=1 Tax=Demequina pelophila TaxID=1638984 RepID=UPI0012DFF210|nr:hypothetical protein [Demequina pelophila]